MPGKEPADRSATRSGGSGSGTGRTEAGDNRVKNRFSVIEHHSVDDIFYGGPKSSFNFGPWYGWSNEW